MILIEKRKTTIINSICRFIRCDNDEIFDNKYESVPYSGNFFKHYALRITR